MTGPRLDDPHFTPARWPLEVETRRNVWDRSGAPILTVTSTGHTGSVELIAHEESLLLDLKRAVDSALSAFDREPKWTPKADARY